MEKALDTAAINQAIEACTTAGGGQVRLPPGTYLSGTVVLKSNVMLHLDAGARLLGTPDLNQYTNFFPPVGTSWILVYRSWIPNSPHAI